MSINREKRVDAKDVEQEEDDTLFSWFPWLTLRRLTFLVIGWTALFAFISLAIANPLQGEVNAAAEPIFHNLMFLHGLLVSAVGLGALLLWKVLSLHSHALRAWVAGCIVGSCFLAAVGGIYDTGIDRVWWGQEYGFILMEIILLLLIVGIIREWTRKSPVSKTIPFITAFLATASMLIAAGMGNLNGMVMEFGSTSPIKAFSSFAGFASTNDFAAALSGSHSHQMVVAAMGGAIVLLALTFGFNTIKGMPKAIARMGLSIVALGIVVMTVMYIAVAFSTWQPPNIGAVAGDDIVTGMLVMGGGLVVIASVLGARLKTVGSAGLVAGWAWLLSFLTIVVAGYYIEQNEGFFGAGAPAAGAANDAVFNFFHQDVGLFLFPALVLALVAIKLYLADRHQPVVSWLIAAGGAILVAGGGIWVFSNPALHGSGYDISAIGLAIIMLGILITLWWGPWQQETWQYRISMTRSQAAHLPVR